MRQHSDILTYVVNCIFNQFFLSWSVVYIFTERDVQKNTQVKLNIQLHYTYALFILCNECHAARTT
jgi:hypothetical protein